MGIITAQGRSKASVWQLAAWTILSRWLSKGGNCDKDDIRYHIKMPSAVLTSFVLGQTIRQGAPCQHGACKVPYHFTDGPRRQIRVIALLPKSLRPEPLGSSWSGQHCEDSLQRPPETHPFVCPVFVWRSHARPNHGGHYPGDASWFCWPAVPGQRSAVGNRLARMGRPSRFPESPVSPRPGGVGRGQTDGA